MEVKIEGTNNWFEMNDAKIVHSNQYEIDKLIEQSEMGIVFTQVREIRITKKGTYLVNDAEIKQIKEALCDLGDLTHS